MIQQSILSPSILSANFAKLGEDTQLILEAGAQWVHVDVMDNHFVPNLTFGPLVCEGLRKVGVTAPLDVHLMISPVDVLIPAFARAGATSISFHPEATSDIQKTITLIRNSGCQVCMAINPDTPISVLTPFLSQLDMVLMMSVYPGFSGQSFIPEVLDKVRAVRDLIDNQSKPIRLQLDGGVSMSNLATVMEAGADTIVMGSAVFNAPSPAEIVKKVIAAMAYRDR